MNVEQRKACLRRLVAGAEFTVRGEEIEGHDARPMPDEDALAAVLPEVEAMAAARVAADAERGAALERIRTGRPGGELTGAALARRVAEIELALSLRD